MTEIPEPGCGDDTLFANMHLAYEMLSPAVRSLLDPLTALHDGARALAGYTPPAPRSVPNGPGRRRAGERAIAEPTAPTRSRSPSVSAHASRAVKIGSHVPSPARPATATPCPPTEIRRTGVDRGRVGSSGTPGGFAGAGSSANSCRPRSHGMSSVAEASTGARPFVDPASNREHKFHTALSSDGH
ncbi:hypothetical protein [Streptomyces sp. NPDC054804]